MSTDKKTDGARKYRLKIFGVGGAGGNIVQRLATGREGEQPLLTGIELAAVNTDAQALESLAGVEKIQVGTGVTHGLSAGGDVEVGMRAAQQDFERLAAAAQGMDVVFIAAGLGGGTGTGAGPVVARAAKEQGALVLAFVALPFTFEGDRRRQQALVGLDQLKMQADAVIAIPNDKLFKLAGDQASVVDAFRLSDEIVISGVQAVWQLLARKGLINLDFGDLRATLGAKHSEGVFSHGTGQGADKAKDAVKALLEHPLFDGGEALAKADGVLVSILGGPDLTLADVQRAVEPISKHASRAHVIMGAAIDETYRDKLLITVIAAGAAGRKPVNTMSRTSYARPGEIPVVRPTRMAAAVPVTPSAPAVPVETETPLAKKKDGSKPRQETLNLEGVTKGRFEKGEPTVYDGENLDIPTYLRQGVRLSR
jgi:cell division protein FtsZ